MSRYIGSENFSHDATPQTGILLCNLGSPDACNTRAVRRYLNEFLSDPRMVEIPKPLWQLILHGFILRTRPRKSAALYKKIWQEQGSPLRVYTQKIAERLQTQCHRIYGKDILVRHAMRYGNPSLAEGLATFHEHNVQRLFILPLFPQYSAVTTASIFDKVSEVLQSWRWLPEIRFLNHYADHPFYISAITESVRDYWHNHPRGQKLLFSFHGLPKRNLTLGDPYFCYCQKTARLVAQELNLKDDEWEVVFQSRFGRAEWLQPYCVERLQALAQSGTRHVDVICPGFATDCLETLEEIAIQNKHLYIDAGGKSLRYIPALNDSDMHIELLRQIINEQTHGWPEFSKQIKDSGFNTQVRATELGALS